MEDPIHLGTDGREHHPYGFSFLGVLDACSGARRTIEAPKNLVDAGERGTELHEVMKKAVLQWVTEVEKGGSRTIDEVVAECSRGLEPDEIRSLARIAEEVKPYFVADENLVIGVEEKINLNNPETGTLVSFGYYDVLLVRGPNALIIDYKFVRREITEAKKNRQGHALALAVWADFPDVTDITVLFTLPDCTSTVHQFRRMVDQPRLEQEVLEIIERAERPWKVLHAGEHCNYCRHRGDCPAAIKAMQDLMTVVAPMIVPATFDPTKVKSDDQLALLRYWASTLEPIIQQIKELALKRAVAGGDLTVRMGIEQVQFKVFSRRAPRKLGEAIDIWNAVKHWMSPEAFIAASSTNITNLTKVAVQVLVDRLLSEGKKPNATQIEKDFCAMLQKKGLLAQEEGSFPFLKRIKIKPELNP